MPTGVTPHSTPHRRRHSVSALLLLLCAACGAGTPAPSDSPRASSVMSANASDDSLHQLTLGSPPVVQTIAPLSGERVRPRFVRIDVTAVTNPARVALSLELRHRLTGQETLLGTVSLFPADNPGRFIVPTLGRVADGGQLVLTLVSPDSGAGRGEVRVTVRRLDFVDQ
jgi:hypothetical protein